MSLLPIAIRITGNPVSKGRPRMTKTGVAFTPAKTRKWEADARVIARQRMFGREQFECPVRVMVIAAFPVPVSWPSWKREAAEAGQIGMTGRPDLDNLAKIVTDACNGIVYRDDSQIVEMTSSKRYAREAFVEIIVEPTGQATPHTKRAEMEAA